MPNISSKIFQGPALCGVCGKPLNGAFPGTWTFSTSKNFKAFYHIKCLQDAKASPKPKWEPPKPWVPPTNPPAPVPEAPEEKLLNVVTPAIAKPFVKKTEHFCFAKLISYMHIRRNDGHHEDIYIPGAPGSGKSFAIKQAAKKNDLRYAYIALSEATQPSQIFGYMDANGHYVESILYNWYKDGGVLDIAELDNTNANIFTLLNNALDNGACSFPCGIVERHKDFIAIGNGNTDLRGPSTLFPGRQKQDAASIARFTFISDWDYDKELEMSLYGEKYPRMVQWVQTLRPIIEQRKEQLVAGTREMRKIHGLLDAGFSSSEALNDGLFKNYQAKKELLLTHPIDF